MNETHFKKLERMYLSAPIQKFYVTTTVNISHERAEIGLIVEDKYFHAANAIHGSIYFRLLDDAAFFAASSVVEDVFVLTMSFNINLLRPVSSGWIKSIGTLKFRSRNLLVAESTLYNEQDKPIAFGTGNFMKSRIALSQEIGYK